jgi:hypothetical protein
MYRNQTNNGSLVPIEQVLFWTTYEYTNVALVKSLAPVYVCAVLLITRHAHFKTFHGTVTDINADSCIRIFFRR